MFVLYMIHSPSLTSIYMYPETRLSPMSSKSQGIYLIDRNIPYLIYDNPRNIANHLFANIRDPR